MDALSRITNRIDGKTYWISTIDTINNIRLNGAMPESLALTLSTEFQAAVFNKSIGLLTKPVLTVNFWGSDLRKWKLDEFHHSICTMVASESVHDLTDAGDSPTTYARYGFMADVEQHQLLWGFQPVTYVFLMEGHIIPV